MNFDNIDKHMKKIQDSQFNYFKSMIYDNMNRNQFLTLFLGTFLDFDYFVGQCKTQSLGETRARALALAGKTQSLGEINNFDAHCINAIDSTSLCFPEIEFFKKMVEIKNTNQYIEKCIDLYHATPDLERCMLAELIIRCLEESKKYEIVP